MNAIINSLMAAATITFLTGVCLFWRKDTRRERFVGVGLFALTAFVTSGLFLTTPANAASKNSQPSLATISNIEGVDVIVLSNSMPKSKAGEIVMYRATFTCPVLTISADELQGNLNYINKLAVQAPGVVRFGYGWIGTGQRSGEPFMMDIMIRAKTKASSQWRAANVMLITWKHNPCASDKQFG